MTVTTKQQVISLLEQNQAELRRLGVSRCGLFGSFRTGYFGGVSTRDEDI